MVCAFGLIGLSREIGLGRLGAPSPVYDMSHVRPRSRKRRGSKPICTYQIRTHVAFGYAFSGRLKEKMAPIPFRPPGNSLCRTKRVAVNAQRTVRRREPLSAGGQMWLAHSESSKHPVFHVKRRNILRRAQRDIHGAAVCGVPPVPCPSQMPLRPLRA